MHRYGAAYSTWPTPTRSGDHIRSRCGGHYQHSGRDAAKIGVSQQTREAAPLNPESWCGDHNQRSSTWFPRTMPPHKDTSIPDMPVSHCVGLHQEWAASADATTVAPTLVGREEARGSSLRKVSARRRSGAGDPHGEGAAAHLAAVPHPAWPRVEAPHLASRAGRPP